MHVGEYLFDHPDAVRDNTELAQAYWEAGPQVVPYEAWLTQVLAGVA